MIAFRLLSLYLKRKMQLNLIHVSKVEVQKVIEQGVYQMVGVVQRFKNVIGYVPSYCVLLTNDLAGIHLRRIDRLDGEVWLPLV